METVNTKDKVLYKRLYDTYYAVLCRYASKLLRRRSGGEEEDIVQEVFIKLWEARGGGGFAACRVRRGGE